MRNTALSIPALLLVLSLAFTAGAWAQPVPAGTIKLIVPFGPGQTPDVIARVLAQKLAPMLGQEIIVENRPGAGGTIGTLAAAKSQPDGYTVLLASTSALSIAPSLYANLGYDAVKSFAPISLVGKAPFLIVVNSSVPARSLQELIDLAKARPGQFRYAADTGTPPHIAGEMFKLAAGVDLVHVPYKVPAAGVNDLLSGQVQVMFQQFATLEEHIRTGKILALAVASPKRHPQLPDVPTTAEAGLPDYVVFGWFGLVAPAGTPTDSIKRLNQVIAQVLETQQGRDTLSKHGLEPAATSPEDFAAFIASETAKWSRAVKASGAKID